MLEGGAKAYMGVQTAPPDKNTAQTLTIAELLAGLITGSGSTARTQTLPTGTNCDAGITAPALPVNYCFDWSFVNTASAAFTIAANTGHTIVGSATIAATSSSMWRTRKTAANTFVTYRLA